MAGLPGLADPLVDCVSLVGEVWQLPDLGLAATMCEKCTL